MSEDQLFIKLRTLVRVGYLLLSVMIFEAVISMVRGELGNTFLAMVGVFVAHYALRYNQQRLEEETEGSGRT